MVKPKMERVVRETISGFSFTIRPTVFNPKDFISSKIFAEYIKAIDLTGKTILDMGSGSGVVSIFAASKGANCVACDINPVAVRCITENALQNKFSSQIKVYESDLFESLNSMVVPGFDIIFFNPPYYKGNPHNNFERAFKGGPNLEVIDQFLLDAKKHLAPGGTICLLVSTDMDMDDLYSRLHNFGYVYKILQTNKKFFETFYIIEAL
ncbi:MAG: HemK2/MTQ2 family protein methyltransferase [Ignavibacteria bacterium]